MNIGINVPPPVEEVHRPLMWLIFKGEKKKGRGMMFLALIMLIMFCTISTNRFH